MSVVSFSIEYENGDTIHTGSSQYPMLHTCILSPPEEIIHNATVYSGENKWGNSVISGIHFHSSRNSCPLFGVQTSNVELIAGHELYYMSGGWRTTGLATLYLHFDYNCEKSDLWISDCIVINIPLSQYYNSLDPERGFDLWSTLQQSLS